MAGMEEIKKPPETFSLKVYESVFKKEMNSFNPLKLEEGSVLTKIIVYYCLEIKVCPVNFSKTSVMCLINH